MPWPSLHCQGVTQNPQPSTLYPVLLTPARAAGQMLWDHMRPGMRVPLLQPHEANVQQLTCTNSVVRRQGTPSWCSSSLVALSVAFFPSMLLNHHTCSCSNHGGGVSCDSILHACCIMVGHSCLARWWHGATRFLAAPALCEVRHKAACPHEQLAMLAGIGEWC